MSLTPRRGFCAIRHCPHCRQPIRVSRAPDGWLGWVALVVSSVVLFGSWGSFASTTYVTEAAALALQQQIAALRVRVEAWEQRSPPERRKWTHPWAQRPPDTAPQ